MSTNYKLPEEWFKQADYDLGTAKAINGLQKRFDRKNI